MEPGSLSARVLEHARDEQFFPDTGLAILAVSGGTDSMALLYLLADLHEALGITLAVAHVDHGIAHDSANVADRVAEATGALGLPVTVDRLALGAGASETRARTARYRALRSRQRAARARYLVTAHQADDQIETVLFRFLRGSGPAGLAGIAAQVRDGLVRPLLPFHRAELADWLARRAPSVTVHDDPANQDPRHDRSWLRTQLLPQLVARFGPALDRRLLGVAHQATADRMAWSEVLRFLPELGLRTLPQGIEVARASVAGYDKMLSQALLRALAREAGFTLGERRSARVREFAVAAESGHALELGGAWVAEVAFDRLRLVRRRSVAAPEAQPWGESGAGECKWGEWCITWITDAAKQAQRAEWSTWVKPGPGTIRAPRPGDRLRPLGGTGRRSVHRVLMEARVPRSDRDSYPVLERDGQIIWIPGVCRSDAALPEPGERALRLDTSPRRHP